jgi:hypothetical protein
MPAELNWLASPYPDIVRDRRAKRGLRQLL